MEIEILEDRNNPVLHRREVRFKVIIHKGATPSRVEVRNKLIAILSADKNAFIVKKIESSFGVKVSEGSAMVYENREAMLKIEAEHLLKKNFSEGELKSLRNKATKQEA
ncbi:30S ribosomal protein S24e [archaeon BMS3Bbin15]|nr:30S ribosomal protein S24e [archaeon BMS3Bbin15]